MDFAEIKTNVEGYVLDSVTATTALLSGTDGFVNKAIRDAEKRPHNFKHMEETDAALTSPGQIFLLARPSLWKRARGFPYLLRDDGSQKEMAWIATLSEAIRWYPDPAKTPVASRAQPEALRDAGDVNMPIYPVPDDQSDYSHGNYLVVVPYWGYTTNLIDPTDTNWWTTNYPWYVIYKAAANALIRNRDYEDAAALGNLAEIEYQLARVADARAQLRERQNIGAHKDVFTRTTIFRK